MHERLFCCATFYKNSPCTSLIHYGAIILHDQLLQSTLHMSGMIYIRRLLFAYIRTDLLAQVFVYTVPHDRVYVSAKGKLSYLN